MARTVLNPPAWVGTWPGVVTVEKVEAPAFYVTAYEVFLDDKSVGFVYSQRTGRATYWGSSASLSDDHLHAGAPSRPVVVDGLVSKASR